MLWIIIHQKKYKMQVTRQYNERVIQWSSSYLTQLLQHNQIYTIYNFLVCEQFHGKHCWPLSITTFDVFCMNWKTNLSFYPTLQFIYTFKGRCFHGIQTLFTVFLWWPTHWLVCRQGMHTGRSYDPKQSNFHRVLYLQIAQ